MREIIASISLEAARRVEATRLQDVRPGLIFFYLTNSVEWLIEDSEDAVIWCDMV